jgi:ParB-like nuclease domain
MIAGRPPKPPETTRTLAIVLPAKITEGADFQRRRNGVDKAHVRTLAQAMRNAGGNLDPILLWQETGPDGVETGRLQLLDGAHRLAAHRSTRKGTQGIPAIIVKCSRDEALLLATSTRSKDVLPLTHVERADAAWLLVRKLERPLSQPKIARAAGVSPRTVFTMQQRLKAMNEAGALIVGEWWRDRNDAAAPPNPDDQLTPEQRTQEIATMAKAIRAACGYWPRQEMELVAEALQVALGRNLKPMTEWLYGEPWDDVMGDDDTPGPDDPQLYDAPISTDTGAARDDPEAGF